MQIKFGSIIVDGQGKIGGHVVQHSRYGHILRTKTSPRNPKSFDQVAIRNMFTSQVQRWNSLTNLQRQSWQYFVRPFGIPGNFGDVKTPSAISIFVKINVNLLLIGQSVLSSAPGLSQADDPGIYSGDANVMAQTFILSYSEAPDFTNCNLLVFATKSLSPGRSSIQNEFRLIGYYDSLVAGDIDLTSDYLAKFKSIGPVDYNIFTYTKMVHKLTGSSKPSGEYQTACH